MHILNLAFEGTYFGFYFGNAILIFQICLKVSTETAGA